MYADSCTEGKLHFETFTLFQGQILSKAEAEEQMTALVGSTIVQGLSSANWKDRLASMEELCLKVVPGPQNSRSTRNCAGDFSLQLLDSVNCLAGVSHKSNAVHVL